MAEEKAKIIVLPEGRGINLSLFVRNVYKDPKTGAEGEPRYKAEVAYDPKQVEGEGTFEDDIADVIEGEWGKKAADDFLDGKPGYFSPFLNGDDLADARAEKGKEGDAYKGKLVLRCNTKWNAEGEDGPGGVMVMDEDNIPIPAINANKVFNGSYGHLAVTLKPHTREIEEADPANPRRTKKTQLRGVLVYLKGWQFTRGEEGDKLKAAAASPFKPTGRAKPEEGGRRRRG